MRFIDATRDPWHALGGDDGPPVSISPEPHLLLDLVQWHAVRAAWPTGVPVGLRLANDQDVETIVDDLPRLALVALHFPKWVDGRAYSQARLLRVRYRYAGEIRAVGEVLVDMVPLLARCGFDAALLRAGQSLEAAERALGFFPAHYQGDVKAPPLFARTPAERAALLRPAADDFIHGGASI